MSAQILHKTTANGLSIVCEHVPTAPVVALQAWVGVGSADETPQEAGLAHLHEHMLFKGTKRRGVGQVAREIEASGGEVNAWTSFDQTVYHITMASKFFDAGLDVLSDMVQHSVFDAEELAREKEVVLEEIRRGEDQPGRRLSQGLFSAAFRKHPYRHPIIGTPKSVRSFGRKDVLAFFNKWYVPNNMVFVVVGDIEPEKAAAAVEKAFRAAKQRKLQRPARARDTLTRGARTFAELTDTGDTYLGLAWQAPELLHEDARVLDVLAEIMGGGDASRLSESIQQEKQLASSVYAHCYTPKDPGLFMIGGNPYAGKERDTVRAIAEELRRVREDGVSDEELQRAKLNLESESVYARQTVQGRARKWGAALQTAGDLEFERKYLDEIRGITAEDIRRAAREYLSPERVSAGIVAPDGGATGAAKKKREQALAAELKKAFASEKTKAPRTGAAKKSEGAQLYKLSNGLRVVVEASQSVPLVSYRWAALGGSRLESPKSEGIYHFLAEMLPRGAGDRTAAEVRREAEHIAGAVQGMAGRNTTGTGTQCLSRFWDRGLELFADVTLAPTLPEDEMGRVRAESFAALEREKDAPTQMLFSRLRAELYGGHPYGYRILGNRENIETFSRKDLSRAHTQLLNPSQMVLSVVGDVDAERVIARLEARFGHLKPRSGKDKALKVSALKKPRYAEILLDRQQAHLAMGFLGTRISAADRYAMEVLNTILAGQGGRLFTNLRDKLSLAYTVTSFAVEGIEPGLFATYIGTAPEKLQTAFDAMMRELDLIRSKQAGRDEITRAKRHLIASNAIDLQSLSARAGTYTLNELYGLGYRADKAYAKVVSAVSAADVRAAAERYLQPGRGVLAVLRPEGALSLESGWLGQ
ncbi:MAG: insulinase family protein [Chrysiogenetes bacterium]|nr:insulinase family protein [Chrysiogenetes bacterium]